MPLQSTEASTFFQCSGQVAYPRLISRWSTAANPSCRPSRGDSDANSIWLLDGDTRAAFVGDFVYNQAHTYMMDGSILRWIANLVRLESVLALYQIYVGHGPATDRSGIVKQQVYFATACSCALEATGGTGVFDDVSRRRYQDAMLAKFPGYVFALTVGYSADALGKELAGIKNYAW